MWRCEAEELVDIEGKQGKLQKIVPTDLGSSVFWMQPQIYEDPKL